MEKNTTPERLKKAKEHVDSAMERASLYLSAWRDFDLFVRYQRRHNMVYLGVIGIPFTQPTDREPPQPQKVLDPQIILNSLSDKEKEILTLYIQGLPWEHIATQLGMAPKTVRTRLSSIRSKLGIFRTT